MTINELIGLLKKFAAQSKEGMATYVEGPTGDLLTPEDVELNIRDGLPGIQFFRPQGRGR